MIEMAFNSVREKRRREERLHTGFYRCGPFGPFSLLHNHFCEILTRKHCDEVNSHGTKGQREV
jgi:hypothetical protein